MRSATCTASRSSARSSTRTANSSPPKRATVSPGRSASFRRGATPVSSSSPAAWPRLSLISLKWSMSQNSTAVSVPRRRDCWRACASRSPNSVLFGSRVSGSCSARRRISSSAARRSMASASTFASDCTKLTSSSGKTWSLLECSSSTPNGRSGPSMTTAMPLRRSSPARAGICEKRCSSGQSRTSVRPPCSIAKAASEPEPRCSSCSAGASPGHPTVARWTKPSGDGRNSSTCAHSTPRIEAAVDTASCISPARSWPSSALCPSRATAACWAARSWSSASARLRSLMS